MDNSVKTNNSKLKSMVQSIEKKKNSNRYEPKVTIEDKMYLDMYYCHQPRNVAVDETLAKIKARELQIVRWMLIKD